MYIIDILFLNVAAAVSAIPEGLPVTFTTTFGSGMRLLSYNPLLEWISLLFSDSASQTLDTQYEPI